MSQFYKVISRDQQFYQYLKNTRKTYNHLSSKLIVYNNWISNVNKQQKTCTDSLVLKRPHTITIINNNIVVDKVDITVAESVNAQMSLNIPASYAKVYVHTRSFYNGDVLSSLWWYGEFYDRRGGSRISR